MNKKTGFVDLEKLEMEADVMSSAGGRMYTDTCSWGCPTCVVDFQPITPSRVCGACYSYNCAVIVKKKDIPADK